MYQLPPGFVPVLVSNTGSLQPLVSIPPQGQPQPQHEVRNNLSVPQDPNGSRRSSNTGEAQQMVLAPAQPQMVMQGQQQVPQPQPQQQVPQPQPQMVMQGQQPQPPQQVQPPQPQMIQHHRMSGDSIEQTPPPQPAAVHFQPEVTEQQQPFPVDYVQQPQPQQQPFPVDYVQHPQTEHVYLHGNPVADNYSQAVLPEPQQQAYLTGSEMPDLEHSSASVSAAPAVAQVAGTAAMHLMDNEDKYSEALEASPSPQPGTDYFENAATSEAEVLAGSGGGAVSEATSGATSVAGDESNVSTQGKSDVSAGDYCHALAAAGLKPCVTVMTSSSLCSSTSSLSSSFSCHDLQNYQNLHASQPNSLNKQPPLLQHQSTSLVEQPDYTQQHREAAAQFRKSSVPTHQSIQIHAEALLRRGSLPPALTSILANQLEANSRLNSRRSSSGTIAPLATLRESHGDSDISMEDLSQVSLESWYSPLSAVAFFPVFPVLIYSKTYIQQK